jgi:hypothetical protein
VQDEFRTVASKLGNGEPGEVWREAKSDHPKVGALIPTAQAQLAKLLAFLERQAIVTVPAGEPVVVAPTPDFYRWASASMWAPGPFESKPSRAYYYLTDVDRSWPAETSGRAPAGLQHPRTVEHLDSRGVPRSLSALPAPAGRRVQGQEVAVFCLSLLC